VLTAFVGVAGLARRMALDRVLPSVLLHTNRLRGTPHWVILGFLTLCAVLFLSIYDDASTRGLAILGSVYSVAFVSRRR
jgi:amino acid transporter